MNKEVEKIRIYGDPVLRKTAEEITAFGKSITDLKDHLITTLYHAEKGIGLAAPQIGVSRQIAVIDISLGKEVDKMVTLINPVITDAEGEAIEEEGCLSIPSIYQKVIRAQKIHVKYLDEKGRKRDMDVEGMIARLIQHEVDHLNGILFIDRIGVVRRALLSKKLRELTKESGGRE